MSRYSLAALTPDQAAEQVFPAAKVTKTAGHTQSVRDLIVQAVNAGQLLDSAGGPAYIPGTKDCAAAAGTGVSSNLKLAQTASGLALTGTTIGLTAAGVVAAATLAPFTLGISAIIGLFPVIFGHHAQAVKKEQSVLCAAVPAANNYLQIIDQSVQQGQATPAQAVQALASLVSDFKSQVGSILKGSSPADSGSCNAACVMLAQLAAIVAYKTSVYQDMAVVQSTPAGAVTSAVSQAAAAAGIPSWALWAFGGLLLWKLA